MNIKVVSRPGVDGSGVYHLECEDVRHPFDYNDTEIKELKQNILKALNNQSLVEGSTLYFSVHDFTLYYSKMQDLAEFYRYIDNWYYKVEVDLEKVEIFGDFVPGGWFGISNQYIDFLQYINLKPKEGGLSQEITDFSIPADANAGDCLIFTFYNNRQGETVKAIPIVSKGEASSGGDLSEIQEAINNLNMDMSDVLATLDTVSSTVVIECDETEEIKDYSINYDTITGDTITKNNIMAETCYVPKVTSAQITNEILDKFLAGTINIKIVAKNVGYYKQTQIYTVINAMKDTWCNNYQYVTIIPCIQYNDSIVVKAYNIQIKK